VKSEGRPEGFYDRFRAKRYRKDVNYDKPDAREREWWPWFFLEQCDASSLGFDSSATTVLTVGIY
jgi:hypothetical protein